MAYASNFKVDGRYRLNTSITSAQRCSSPGTSTAHNGWEIKSVGPDGREVREIYEFIIVASGLNQTCSGLQLGPEGGDASHTCSIRGNRLYNGKKVVIVGLGESSSDATADIANAASKVMKPAVV